MAAGTAVVATRVAGTREVVDESVCVLVRPGNEQDLCDAVVGLCRDPQLRSRLGWKARTLAEQKYSWGVLSQQFLRECERIALPYAPKRPFHFEDE
jgi:glycosyltransferase involved in cell wall biosynthesis